MNKKVVYGILVFVLAFVAFYVSLFAFFYQATLGVIVKKTPYVSYQNVSWVGWQRFQVESLSYESQYPLKVTLSNLEAKTNLWNFVFKKQKHLTLMIPDGKVIFLQGKEESYSILPFTVDLVLEEEQYTLRPFEMMIQSLGDFDASGDWRNGAGKVALRCSFASEFLENSPYTSLLKHALAPRPGYNEMEVTLLNEEDGGAEVHLKSKLIDLKLHQTMKLF